MTGAAGAAAARLAVYVHWPFCLSKCPYCDFNSHVRETIDEAAWRRALLAEIDHFAALAPGRRAGSLFFGGGTPSLMAPETAAAVIERVNARWPFADDAEITLEANPTSAEAGRFRAFREAGVNRLSLGVQALDDRALRFLGRGHDVAEALAALEAAQAVFARVSFDLIYARPGQTLAAWRAELGRALGFGTRHLSLYQLTIEPGAAFHARAARGEIRLPEDETAAALYDLTQELCAAAGLPAYEVSNHAAQGEESRHNLAYWRGEDYVGLGPGAHGRLTLEGRRVAFRQSRAPETWLAQVAQAGHGTCERRALGVDEHAAELLMMGLRLAEGVARARFEAQTGVPLDRAVDAERLAELVEGGLMIADGRGIRTTPAGRRLLDSALAALVS